MRTLSDLEARLLRTLYCWQFEAANTLTAVPWFCLEAEHWGEAGLAVRRSLVKLCSRGLVSSVEAYPPDGVYRTPGGRRVVVTRGFGVTVEMTPSGDGFSVQLPANCDAHESWQLTADGIDALTADSASSTSLPADDAQAAHVPALPATSDARPAETATVKRELAPCYERAWRAWRRYQDECPAPSNDPREAWPWIVEHLGRDGLPSTVETFATYVRKVEAKLSGDRNSPRSGRHEGLRSVVQSSAVQSRRDDGGNV